jgi:RNA polymerase sigma factor (sigma-70 family)
MRSSNARAEEFDRLLREHVPALFRYAYRWCGSVDRAEDLVQELLMRLYPRLEELRSLERIRPWAARVMYRIFIDELRRERRSPVQAADQVVSVESEEGVDDEPLEAADVSTDPSILADREITQQRIVAVWEMLSHQHRVVLSMHDIEGYSLGEVASVMEEPVGTMKSRLHRARSRLRKLLGEGTISTAQTCTPTDP